ncbi:malonate decarboxylase holo-[acyl-carrier-protein] synthase [Variovorax sp. KK3]|uniref:malonate decarboxylase holo-[acyl-carrier-protein] synthase n=1 Tax=Variovorax sp. KK3 TaxID=1855728 RepID=UPI002118BFD4|nr:malonate decarboxylase holo-[acyl-carrier-protein] synthase [Variovorax sp. KK3]
MAYLSAAGWHEVLARAWDEEARACLMHWAAHRLPLVVTRQGPPDQHADAAPIALGLPAPLRWGRRRLALQVARRALVCFDEFPRAAEAGRLLPRPVRAAWRVLDAALGALHAGARVYGSHGWQLLSGLDHVHPGSDIDLWIGVDDVVHADSVARELEDFAAGQRVRLDGELVFPDGAAVAWREWHAWRAGRTRRLLVKRLDGATLAESDATIGFRAHDEVVA